MRSMETFSGSSGSAHDPSSIAGWRRRVDSLHLAIERTGSRRPTRPTSHFARADSYESKRDANRRHWGLVTLSSPARQCLPIKGAVWL